MTSTSIQSLVDGCEKAPFGRTKGEFLSSLIMRHNHRVWETLTGVLDPIKYGNEIPKFIWRFINVNWER